ncbi:apolipoprotein N-acyltransferase [Campylobacter lanienae]|uniref:apolipoprotein N-acyltransferase n=1 Tax=Campylobacter lanienae TaxID=75658 RepID=UPI00242DCF77|nr:apolipoprotein N-acyltransferase [Campylobacter lanienae]MDD5785686.1 apolipoprotein N-acyltransferase [Campylobacter lanienae]
MKLALNFLPCESFKKKLVAYFTLKFIIKGFMISILLSLFIFLDLLNLKYIANLGLLSAIIGLYILLKSDRKIWFWSGFFIGLFWFYWISFSLIYYNFGYLIPIEILGICLIYGFIFLAVSWLESIYIKAIFLLFASYVAPFGFDWLNFELIFVDTIFKPTIYTLALVLISIIISIKFSKYLGLGAMIVSLIISYKFTDNFESLPFNISLITTELNQNQIWDRNTKNDIIKSNLNIIDQAILDGSRAVVLPESAFPLFLDRSQILLSELKQKSHQIAIITGALGASDNKLYNSTYIFDKGEVKRLDKLILVPFGEEIPLPNFIKNPINNIFFDSAVDYSKANGVSDYEIDGVKIRNAICYEATKDELFKDNPKFMIAISNNAWFSPSTQPNLQSKILKLKAFKYKTTIYHSINGSPSQMITP